MKTWEQMTRKEQLIAECSDAYKEAYYSRPNVLEMYSMSETELENLLNTLGDEITED